MKSRITVFTLFALLLISTAQAAKVGGTFTRMFPAEPATLNPVSSTDLYATRIYEYTMDSFMYRDPDTYEFKPLMAEKVEGSKDGMEWTFTLREGLKWHDGKPVTMEDVKFSYEHINDPAYQAAHKRPFYENIGVPEVINERTVKFKFKQKYFLNFDVLAGTSILPAHIYKDPKAKVSRNLVGSGCYKVEKYEKGKRIVLARNPDWVGFKIPDLKDVCNFEKFVIRFVNNSNVALEMFKKGELDFMELTNEQFVKNAVGPEWGTKLIKVKAQNKAAKGYGFVAWNLTDDMFKERDVRTALAMLINRPLMIEKFRYGLSIPADGPIYPLSDFASPKVKSTPFDTKKALELLTKSGWKDSDKNGILDKTISGKKVELSFTIINPNEEFNKYLTVYKEDAKKVGVDINIKVVEWNTFMKLIDETKFQAVVLGWGGGAPESDLKQIWHTESTRKGGSNFNKYSNPEVDKLIDQVRVLLDKKDRVPLTQKIHELIWKDQPYAFLFTEQYILYAHSSRVKKPKDTFNYEVGLTRWWVE